LRAASITWSVSKSHRFRVAQRDALAKAAPRHLSRIEDRKALDLGGRQIHVVSFECGQSDGRLPDGQLANNRTPSPRRCAAMSA